MFGVLMLLHTRKCGWCGVGFSFAFRKYGMLGCVWMCLGGWVCAVGISQCFYMFGQVGSHPGSWDSALALYVAMACSHPIESFVGIYRGMSRWVRIGWV